MKQHRAFGLCHGCSSLYERRWGIALGIRREQVAHLPVPSAGRRGHHRQAAGGCSMKAAPTDVSTKVMSGGWAKESTWASLELNLETCSGVHQSENGCDGWNLLPDVPANDLVATASSERCLQIQGCRGNRSSVWRKALFQAVNPTSCAAQHPEVAWFLLKGLQVKCVLEESSLADQGWPRLLLALPGCWIFKWKLGLRSWTELWEIFCGREM